jgi:hypothetical protein
MKIRGRTHYFGVWTDPDGALVKYLAERDFLQAGETPPPDSKSTPVADMCNRFLTAKLQRVQSGEPAASTFQDYKRNSEVLIRAFGWGRSVDRVSPTDFTKLRGEIAFYYGPARMCKKITQVPTTCP